MKTTRQDQRQTFNRDTWSSCNCCQGRGLIRPMIHTNPEYTCATCNGIGWIPPDGEPLNEHEVIRMMRQIINRQSRRIRQLRSDMEPKPRTESVPEYYGDGRYHGD